MARAIIYTDPWTTTSRAPPTTRTEGLDLTDVEAFALELSVAAGGAITGGSVDFYFLLPESDNAAEPRWGVCPDLKLTGVVSPGATTVPVAYWSPDVESLVRAGRVVAVWNVTLSGVADLRARLVARKA